MLTQNIMQQKTYHPSYDLQAHFPILAADCRAFYQFYYYQSSLLVVHSF